MWFLGANTTEQINVLLGVETVVLDGCLQGLDLTDLKNYRPVSNLPFLSKLLERVV